MNQLVFIQNNEVLTDSITIAEMFNKEHRNVTRDIESAINNIESLKKSVEIKELDIDFSSLKFEQCDYKASNGQIYKKYLLNFDAFMLVTMSYTTQKAMLIKVKYINEFNKMQEELKNNKPKTQLEILQGTINQLVEQEKKMSLLETKIEKAEKDVNNISNIVSLNNVQWREKVRVILSKISQNWTGVEPYRSVRNLSYEKLEKRAGCNLNIRLNNRKERAIAQGMTKSYVNKISKLDCIAEEKRLVEIYIQVVKEMAIQFKVDINDFKEVI
ncbi:Rha family transcriptional regulator [Oceanobacillus caeni]|uniref:Rha family transcriptional regulator n=1 Tax=Oceanobacillus caeni TaxID=405946 RepID=UPI002149FD66|nr:Rha family transcriptional regulator [Oceanobacillus caeni]MCR1833111.1 Rha family transcriptional regulator [Oceanobacillus caeni]